jgi:hypothetical protein
MLPNASGGSARSDHDNLDVPMRSSHRGEVDLADLSWSHLADQCRGVAAACTNSGEPTSGLEPLTPAHYE